MWPVFIVSDPPTLVRPQNSFCADIDTKAKRKRMSIFLFGFIAVELDRCVLNKECLNIKYFALKDNFRLEFDKNRKVLAFSCQNFH
jgi:hypothetical protein